MQAYYYLSQLHDSPYGYSLLEALHLGATGKLGIYIYLDSVVLLRQLDTSELRAESGFYLRLPPRLLATAEKQHAKYIESESAAEDLSDQALTILIDNAIVDARFDGTEPCDVPLFEYSKYPCSVTVANRNKTPVECSTMELLCWSEDLDKLAQEGSVQGQWPGVSLPAHQQYPPHLEALVLAWRKYWQNADPDDRTACPKKERVVNSLIEQGFSAKSADAGATIIKPQWAKDKGW